MLIQDFKLEKRNIKFNKNNLSHHFSFREKFSLNLRKEKLDTKIMERRINYLANKDYQINKEILRLPKKFEENFEKIENKLIFVINFFSEENKNIDFIKFYLFYLREYTCEMENNTIIIKESDLIKLFDLVIGLFFNSKDKQIMYETSWILINLTYFSNNCTKELLKEEYLNNLSFIFETSDEVPILNHLIFIFANILGDNKETRAHFINKNPKYHIRLKQLLLRDEFSLGFKRNLIWNLSNLIKGFHSLNFNEFLDIIHIFIKNIKLCSNLNTSQEEYLLQDTLLCITQFNDNNDNTTIIQKFLDEGLFREIIQIFGNPKSSLVIRNNIIKVLSFISYGSENQLNTVASADLLQLLESEITTFYNHRNKLEEDDVDYLIDVLFLISIISGSTKICEKVFITKLPEIIKAIAESVSNTNVKYESMKIFTNGAQFGSNKTRLDLIKMKVIYFAIDCLICHDNDLILKSLECIEEFLQFASKFKILNNVVKLDIENYDKVDNFYKLDTSSSNEEISKMVKKILSTYWNSDDMNLDFK